MDRVPTAVAILVGVGVVAVLAGFNEQLGKTLAVFMIIIAMVWLIGTGTQGHLANWESLLGGVATSSSTGTGGGLTIL